VTFQSAAFAVDGNPLSGNFLRLMQQSATGGSQGIIGAQDMYVTANTVPNPGINIAPGACVVLGSEAAYQGSYYGYNVGVDTSLTIAATGGAVRSDMIVVRAEDPTWSGSPWGNPAAGQILFPRVISGVSPGATSVPGMVSAIPLARIDMPVSTSVVQQSYIHDLRYVSQPQRIMQQVASAGPASRANWTVSTTAHAWPPGATWPVFIPAWATTMVMSWTVGDLLWVSGTARGFINPVFGSSVTAPAVAFPQVIVSVPATEGAAGAWRHTCTGASTTTVPASLRGTTQTLQFAQVTDGVATGLMSVDENSQVSVIFEFQQLASAT